MKEATELRVPIG